MLPNVSITVVHWFFFISIINSATCIYWGGEFGKLIAYTYRNSDQIIY
jgi:hypothetical protein